MKLFAFLTLFISFSSAAGSGKVIVPHWAVNGSGPWAGTTYIYVSNITDSVINVSVVFYDRFGTKLPPSEVFHFHNNTQLEGRMSGYVSIKPINGQFNYGHAVIHWSDIGENDNTVGVIASGLRFVSGHDNARSDVYIPINNGMPF